MVLQIRDQEALMSASNIRWFIERARVAASNRVTLLDKDNRRDELVERILEHLRAAEDEIESAIKVWMRVNPVWLTWGQYVPGVGAMTLGGVMGRCKIELVTTVSKMWAHYGFAPGQKPVAGELLTYDSRARTMVYRCAQNLMVHNPHAYQIYQTRRAYEEAKVTKAGGRIIPVAKGRPMPQPPDMALKQLHFRSTRVMLKAFLACLWIVWREAEGLPTRSAYIEEHPGTDGFTHRWHKPEEWTKKEDIKEEHTNTW